MFGLITKYLQRAYFLEQLSEEKPGFENQIEDISEGRRQFLKTIGSAAMIAPMGQLWLDKQVTDSVRNLVRRRTLSSEKVCILGGGISGLTTAYRLTQAGIACEIFEASGRLGGRIFTKNNFNSQGMFCELGGELIDSTQMEILDLAGELGVAIDDLTVGDAEIENQHYYFGGQHYYSKDIIAAFRPLAAHLKREALRLFTNFKDPELNYKTHTRYAAELDQVTLAEYLAGKTDVDKWAIDLIRIAYLGEYGLDTEYQSALNLHLLILGDDFGKGFSMFGSSDESRRIRGGNSRLIEALAAAITPQVKVHYDSALVKMTEKGSNVEMTFQSGSGKTVTVSSSKIICTIPFSILRSVEGISGLGLSPVKLQCINTLGYGKNTKFMMGFKSRSWRLPTEKLPGSTGYTFTDLPSQVYWDTSRNQNGTNGVLTNFIGGSAATTIMPNRLEATLKDLDQVYPELSSLYDGNNTLFAWAKNPYSLGSYTCPTPGQWTSIVGSSSESELGGKLLFAGEHTSETGQGYMNGAVASANAVTQKIIAQVRGLVASH